MSKKPKKFKVFYFPDPNDNCLAKQEIILADDEADAEARFRENYRKEIDGNETFFGWVEEIAYDRYNMAEYFKRQRKT